MSSSSSSQQQQPQPKRRRRTGWRSRPLLSSVFSLAVLSLLCLLGILLPTAHAVRHHEFKRCDQSSFCRRLRRLSDYTSQHINFPSPYSVLSSEDLAFQASSSTLKAAIKNALHPDIQFELSVKIHQDGTARVQMDQVGKTYKGLKRYNEAELWSFESYPISASSSDVAFNKGSDKSTLRYGPSKSFALEIQHEPLKLTFLRDGVPQIVMNERSLLQMEHFRAKPDPFPSIKPNDAQEDKDKAQLVIVYRKRDAYISSGVGKATAEMWARFEEEDEGEWEENFSGKPDSKPKGPEALSLDITFVGYDHVFGIPEHASPLSLRETRGKQPTDYKDPYRLFNLDVFEYEHDSPMALYGAIPVMHAQAPNSSVSVFWLNGAETWIDIEKAPSKLLKSSPGIGKGGQSGKDTNTQWMSESGILDALVYLGPDVNKNMDLFTRHTGRTAMPQYFALGYHQCRWNYLSTSDVLQIPMDVLWLDIEYSKDHMYGVWDEANFPHPESMLEGLDAKGRKLVIIIDPHLKRTDDFFLYNQAQQKDVLVKSPDGKSEFEGWCWSGSSSWVDMFHPASWKWWHDIYKLSKNKLKANARNLHIWNDMNEPSVFNGPEITCPKDVVHYGGWENRDLHNINGVLFHNNTAKGLQERESPNRRPFVLSRSFWAGSQRFGAVWTGDNLGDWEHLAVSVPMMLADSIGGMAFVGSDVGGFFGNPSPDMLVRWYQSGIFMPFFRAHAHIDTKRREPYLLDEPLRSAVRDLIKLRYKHLPLWYTAFKESAASGQPVIRPQYMMFPADAKGFAVDDQYYIGDSGLLVKPPVAEKQTSVDIYLAEDQPYYHYFSHDIYYGSSSGKHVTINAPLDETVPLLHRGGSIMPLRERVRRSAELGWRDPITLIVALNKPPAGSSGDTERATGVLYLDDGQTYDFEKGSFIWRRFTWTSKADGSHVLSSEDESLRRSADKKSILPASGSKNAFAQAIKDVRVERVVVLGLDKEPKSIKAGGKSVDFVWSAGTSAAGSKLSLTAPKTSELIIRDPKVLITEDFSVEIA